MSKRQPRPSEQINEELGIQLNLLKKACHAYDLGDVHEVRNISRALRLLVCGDDHGNASLIELAGCNSRQILDAGTYSHKLSFSSHFALAPTLLQEGNAHTIALLSDTPLTRRLTFKDWREQVVVKIGSNEPAHSNTVDKFNRIRLIKAVANFGGGTHFPPDVEAYFNRLTTSYLVSIGRPSGEKQVIGIEKTSLRQIAHELLVSLTENYECKLSVKTGSRLIMGCESIFYPGSRFMFNISTWSPTGTSIIDEGDVFPMRIGELRIPPMNPDKNGLCYCQSGVPYRECCKYRSDLTRNKIKRFERRNYLGQYRLRQGIDSNGQPIGCMPVHVTVPLDVTSKRPLTS